MRGRIFQKVGFILAWLLLAAGPVCAQRILVVGAQGQVFVSSTKSKSKPLYLEDENIVFSARPYGKRYKGHIRPAVGDFNGDGRLDFVTAAGKGKKAGPLIRTFLGTARGSFSSGDNDFFAFQPRFRGGVYVAAGDITNDGVDEIIVGAGKKSSEVIVFDSVTSTPIYAFEAFKNFTGGVSVACGDVTGDGVADIITGSGRRMRATVKVFDGATREEISSFFAYPRRFRKGILVTSGDIDDDGIHEVIVTANKGRKPVRVFDALSGQRVLQFKGPSKKRGERTAIGDINGDGSADIISAWGQNNRVNFFSHSPNPRFNLQAEFFGQVKTGPSMVTKYFDSFQAFGVQK